MLSEPFVDLRLQKVAHYVPKCLWLLVATTFVFRWQFSNVAGYGFVVCRFIGPIPDRFSDTTVRETNLAKKWVYIL